jgi:hypothetical protein
MAFPTPSQDPSAYGPTVPAHAGYGPPRPPASPARSAEEGVLARLPLQIGTTSTWSAGRSAAALFPGFALMGAAVSLAAHMEGGFEVVAILAVAGALLVAYSVMHAFGAVRTRASDLLLLPDALVVDGGRLHGEKIAWSELSEPYAQIEDTTEKRITMGSIFLILLAVLTRSPGGRILAPVQVWRLHVYRGGQQRTVAQTDRAIERDSMIAAASSVCAVASGQRYVAEAPTVAARILSCSACGAPAIPDDADSVVCGYCNARVAVPPDIRGQAAAAKALSSGRSTTTEIIAKLRDQPRAARTNTWLLVLSGLMFGAWPLGWGLIAYRVLEDGFQASDLFFLTLPFSAVLAGFFLARARLADRGALQLLTLGFGALAPRRAGEPSRCRRCQGPLPSAGLGGVTQCRYCAAENIVGIDLRPSVDPARTQQHTFDDALKKRADEKRLWTVLSLVAGFALLCWIGSTITYIMSMDPTRPPHGGGRPSSTTWPTTPPKSPPPPHPGGTKKQKS